MPKNAQTAVQLHSFHMQQGDAQSPSGWSAAVCELKTSRYKAGFRKGRGIRDQIANIHCIIEKAAEFQKNIYFCFFDYIKAFDCVDHNKMWKFLREREYQTIFPASCEACAVQEEAVGARHGTMDWFRIGSSMCEGCVLSPWLFHLHAEYIM